MKKLWLARKASRDIEGLFPDICLSGPRILMRPPAPEDWSQWATQRGANIDHIQPFEPLWAEDSLTEDFFRRRLQRQSHEWKTGRARNFLILKKGGCLIGGMNINNICRAAAQYASLGYWISKDHEGQGYMAEALKLTLEYCFSDLKLHRVHASCLLHNKRSKNLLLKGGFTEEGMAQKYLKINGKWQDHLLFGYTIEDWIAQQKP